MKKKIAIAVAGLAILGASVVGCTNQSDTVSHNLSQDADSFKITRQVVFHNDITDTYIAEITGLCALGNDDAAGSSTVICKIGEDSYVKEIIRTGDNVSVYAIQTEPASSDPYHYTVIFRPETVIPNVQVQTSGQ